MSDTKSPFWFLQQSKSRCRRAHFVLRHEHPENLREFSSVAVAVNIFFSWARLRRCDGIRSNEHMYCALTWARQWTNALSWSRQSRCDGTHGNEHIVLLAQTGNVDAMEYEHIVLLPESRNDNEIQYAATNILFSWLNAAMPMRWKTRQRTYCALTWALRQQYYGKLQVSPNSPTWTWQLNAAKNVLHCALTWAGRRWGAESAECRGLTRRSRRVVRQCTPCLWLGFLVTTKN